MHNLLFSEGGQPLHLDDLNFLQQAFTEPLLALASTWGNCIISGCEIRVDKETSITSATSGIIAFEGKLYRVSAHSLGQTEPSNEFFWLFSEREDGYKSFEDGNEHPTQRLCTAELLSTREAPSTGKYIAENELPRLGIDIAPKPRFFKDFRYEGTLGQLVDFRELSPYSGILTLCFAPKESLPKDGYFAKFFLKGVNNMSGEWSEAQREGNGKIYISLTNGKLSAREEYGTDNHGTTSHISFATTKYISFLITWDYETDNGSAQGINAGVGSTYTGVGRSIYDDSYRGASRSSGGNRSRR